MAAERCKNCRSPLSTQGACPRLACLPRGQVRVGGAGSGPGNFTKRSIERRIHSGRCILCAEANCWKSACSNGPFAGGRRVSCDCHGTLANAPILHGSMAPRPQLKVRSFSQWDRPRPAF